MLRLTVLLALAFGVACGGVGAAENYRADRDPGRWPYRASPERATPPNAPAANDSRQSETDCERAQREYRQSQECFAPYVNANGSVRAEAYARCREVKQPPLCR